MTIIVKREKFSDLTADFLEQALAKPDDLGSIPDDLVSHAILEDVLIKMGFPLNERTGLMQSYPGPVFREKEVGSKIDIAKRVLQSLLEFNR